MKKHPLTCAALMLGAMLAHADPFVITHPGLKLQASDIKDIFLGIRQFAGPIKVVPVDNEQTQSQFLATTLKIDSNKYRHVWARRTFQDGITPPAVKGTDGEVLEYVKRTPGAVSYMGSDPGNMGVNVVGR